MSKRKTPAKPLHAYLLDYDEITVSAQKDGRWSFTCMIPSETESFLFGGNHKAQLIFTLKGK